MSTPANPGRNLFLNLPIADLQRSKAFFGALGFTFNPKFEDESSTCMLVGEQAFVMLLEHAKFEQFSHLPTADPRTHTLALFCFSVAESSEVDAVTEAAVAAGATELVDDQQDYGFMRSRAFYDLDGHGWQVMWMDPAAVEQGPEAFAEGAAA